MGIGDVLDRAIAPFAPSWAARRVADRAAFEVNTLARDAVRKIDAGANDRRTEGWSRRPTSADGENQRYRIRTAAAAHDLVANNKNAAAGIRQLVAASWGDGIQPQFDHPVKLIRERAQADWDRWAEGKVDGQSDWYGHGKVAVREMFVGGEALTVWLPDDMGPDGFVVGMESAHLDASKSVRLQNGNKVVQGVEFAGALRANYWLFEEHPHDPMAGAGKLQSKPVAAMHVDHLYERLRFGQTRGLSILGPVALTLHDIGQIEDAVRMRERLQACIGLIITPEAGQESSALKLGETAAAKTIGAPGQETIRPGMISRTAAGETVTTLNPTPSQTTVDYVRQQLASVSATLAPYHLMTGDVSKATYTALRAAMNGFYSTVGDWQQNDIIPHQSRPAAQRRLRRLAMASGDRRYLDCTMTYALPRRHIVDPIKDLMGEILELRAGLKDMTKALAERGIRTDRHIATLQQMNKMLDDAGLILDIDSRYVSKAGVMQKLAEMATDRASLLENEE
jgi:lambda family phage portal protein